MKSTRTRSSKLTRLALAFAGMLGAVVPAQSGLLSISNEPLGAPAGLILPNIMFILDDSGSMDSDYMPEFVNDSEAQNVNQTASCADTGDETGSGNTLGAIDGAADPCRFGDPPYNSVEFNEIYYNPGLYYAQGVHADPVTGVITDLPIMNRVNTNNWTQVPVHPYTSQTLRDLVTNTDVTIMNLAAGYPDRVWCAAKADSPIACRQNTAYQYPDAAFPFGQDTSNNRKYIGGSPYYYHMQTAQYCTTAARTTCVSGSSVVLNTHTFQAPEFCTDRELTNCAAGAAVTSAHTFSGPRWCTDATTLTNCRRKKLGTYVHPKHLGVTQSQTCTVASPCPAHRHQGNIFVSSVAPAGGTITGITIGLVPVIAGPIAVPANTTTDQVAAQIAAAIQSFASTPEYTATASGNSVTVERAALGAAGAGLAIAVTANSVGTQSAIGRVEFATLSGNAVQEMTSLTVNTTNNLLCDIAVTDTSYGSSIEVRATNGRIYAGSGTNTGPERDAFRNATLARINACTAQNGGYTAALQAPPNDLKMNIIAPQSLGASVNNQPIAPSGVGNFSKIKGYDLGSVQLGISTGDVTTSTLAMSGGEDGSTSGTRIVRKGVGAFSRTDVVSSINSYPKGSKRSDCAGATCTYEEEMTNIANWFTYYRTRMQMMKTAVARAFIPIDTNYRVGFITICPVGASCTGSGNTLGQTVVPAKYLKIADFTVAHKKAWYDKLLAIVPGGSTPLREALSRVGTIYAGRFGSGLTTGLTAADDPVTRSCQPNFALLSTDGYWNGGPGYKEDGATLIGNQDNANVGPYSLQTNGVFDGGTPVASDSLADVALYYYKTDLRTSGPVSQNNVAVTNKDIAPHQHMVTFTLGLGLDGELSFVANYEIATSGDFFDIKQGTKKWPVPVADSPSALDDLWHTAVNGRGVFYSIKNPADLAASLVDMRDQLEARLGAGAAAATSNLQPVAGDNFAFTASFTTSTWTGDLKARTIDLASGIVSTATLWSAATVLDTRAYTTRQIYTFDPSDTTVTAAFQSGNRLKHFCAPGTAGAACLDGAGLTPSPGGEMDFFAASQLPQSFDPGQLTTATNASLVNYLRGDRSFENSSVSRTFATDLYRARDSIMGDIVNAQPSYVKRSPFSYGDTGYLPFRACTEGIGTGCPAALFPTPFLPRRGTVYAASNDGMLHAFETDTTNNPYYQTGGIGTPSAADDTFVGDNTGNGVERWTYIPGLVLPKIYKLASDPYSHTYTTDGTPQVGDICVSTPCAGIADWRTILVGGLNSGGNGYYALDITNPLAPKAMWEFTHGTTCVITDAQGVPTGPVLAGPPAVGPPFSADCHVGLSFGNAVITKRFHDQKWVVMVTSGYNNNSGTAPNNGDGSGYLYMLDAVTGKILHRMRTGVGSAASPSGLSKINGWTTNGAVDNTALAIYGGDLEGNLWRFKVDFPAGGAPSVTKVAVVKDSTGATQPITVKPELGDVAGERIIVFGTGKFLEAGDKTPPETVGPPPVTLPFQKQTFYALRDSLGVTGAGPVIPNVRDSTAVKVRIFAASSADNRTVAVPGNDPALVANPALPSDPSLTAPPNLAVDAGWLIDLPDNGERVNVDPVLQLGTIVFASNIPTTDTCSAGGYSFINFLGLTDGAFVPGATNNLASTKISTSILVGVNVIMLPGGAVKTIGTLADETRRSEDTPVPPAAFVGRRVSWRELFIDQ